MAVKSNHQIIREWKHPERRTGVAITAKGFMLRKRVKGGTWNRAHPKEGLTLADIDRIITGKGYERVHCCSTLAFPDAWVPNPVEKHEKRNAARKKRDEKYRRELEAQEAAERADSCAKMADTN